MLNKEQLNKEVLEAMHQTYVDKNSDYGDSFEKTRIKYPTAILIRLNDKLSRLETLMSGEEQKILDESIDDTLIDLANYAVMEYMERKIDEVYLQGYNERVITKE